MKKRILIFINISLWIIVLVIFLFIFLNKAPSSIEIFKKSQSSVVELKSQTGESLISYGTAVFISDEGYLATNAHVVTYKHGGEYKMFESYEIRFSFETDYRTVSLIRYDLEKDISILKLDDISNIEFKKNQIKINNNLSSGDKVYAIGNGMNHGVGISEGLISLPQVNIEYEGIIKNVIQCDLIINEGNSGGALLDEYGNLIGITTFRLKDSGGNVIYGIAYCIPIDVVIDYFKNL
ncbi:MAG: S1C family serine protease [Anaeroplasmataceae bacterium]